jgi:UDP-glucose 4-epimerase
MSWCISTLPVRRRRLPYEITGRGNVYRAIEVLGACHAAEVPRVVMRSSLLVYGARPDAPAFIPESAPLSSGAPAGLLQDYIEIERLVGDFKVRHPDMRIVMIRCAPVAGNGVRSPVVQFLSRRPAPVLAGFDPRIQVLHTHDAAVALALATLNDQVEGAFNIAAHPPADPVAGDSSRWRATAAVARVRVSGSIISGADPFADRRTAVPG